MKYETIYTGNKEIGVFDGWRQTIENPKQPNFWISEERSTKISNNLFLPTRDPSCFAYHNDWLWLMGVIDKIEKLGFSVVIQKGMCHIFSDEYPLKNVEFANKSNNCLTNKIELTWMTVLDFVLWYKVEILNVKPIEKPLCGVGEKNRN
jgi:hypothetical protein